MIGWLTRWDGTCRLWLAGITKSAARRLLKHGYI